MKIIFIDTVHPILKSKLENLGHECVEAYDKSKNQLLNIVSNFEGIVIRSRFKIDASFLEKCTQLKFIARAGSGLENIDLKSCQDKGIHCINAPEGNRQAVAEHALGMLLNLFNNINQSNHEVRQGLWEREANRGVEINGKTVGIIGYGNNGSAFAQALSGLGVRILAYDKYLNNYGNSKVIESNMKQIFNQCDIVSLHVPLTKETTYMINNAFIKSFNHPFYLINTARGKCVDTKALNIALKSGEILGACLDVHEYEKLSFEETKQHDELQKLLNFKNVVLTPHVAGWTNESHLKIAEVLFNKIKSVI